MDELETANAVPLVPSEIIKSPTSAPSPRAAPALSPAPAAIGIPLAVFPPKASGAIIFGSNTSDRFELRSERYLGDIYLLYYQSIQFPKHRYGR